MQKIKEMNSVAQKVVKFSSLVADCRQCYYRKKPDQLLPSVNSKEQHVQFLQHKQGSKIKLAYSLWIIIHEPEEVYVVSESAVFAVSLLFKVSYRGHFVTWIVQFEAGSKSRVCTGM